MHRLQVITRLLTLAAVIGCVGPAQADPLERYAELQAVGEAINDPDPLMRLALLEEIIAKGDATEVQLAIRTAFTIDDPNIRSLALRAHFASFRTVVITAEYPPEIQAILDSQDSNAIAEVRKSYSNQFKFMGFLGATFSYRTEYEPGNSEFKIVSLNANTEPNDKVTGFGNIKGSLITMQSVTRLEDIYSSYNCVFEFSEYTGFTIKGFGSCDFDKTLPFPVTLHLFEPDVPAS